MPTPYDVPSPILIEKLAQYLKNNVDSMKPPEWAPYVKTGVYAQRPPQNADWWYVRCASLLRKIYTKGPIGLEHLASEYGGRKSFGVKPQHARKGSGMVIKRALLQLQNAGLVDILKPKGRIVTPAGRKILDALSAEIRKEIEKDIPELKKY